MPYYITKRSPRSRDQRTMASVDPRPIAMGDFWTDLIGGASPGVGFYVAADKMYHAQVEIGCLNKAETDAAVAAINQQLDDVSKNWRPSGYYSPSQIMSITTMINTGLIGAQAYLTSAPNQADPMVKQIGNDLNRKLAEAKKFIEGAAAAMQKSITVVEAPGLQRWVLFSMTEMSQAITLYAMQKCMRTVLDTALEVITAIGDFLKKLVNIAIAAGQAILKIPDAIGTVWSIVKWGTIAGGAYYIYREFFQKK